MSLKQSLLDHISQKLIVNISDLYRIAEDEGRKYGNAERRLRELTEKKLIEPIVKGKAIIGYRYAGNYYKTIPISDTAKQSKMFNNYHYN